MFESTGTGWWRPSPPPIRDARRCEQIEDDLRSALRAAGFDEVDVVTEQQPPWSSDWITPEGLEKLTGFGIAPPGGEIVCPRCRSGSPRLVSKFGSTACKALMACRSCGEPFDHFKEF